MQKITKSTYVTNSPEIFCIRNKSEESEFKKLIAENNPVMLDCSDEQVKDLIQCLYPSKVMQGIPLEDCIAEWLDGRLLSDCLNWVYFPWKNTVVRLLKESEFITCRTNRNKFKITEAEQQLLSKKNVLFIGLSVGQSVAYTMARERACGHLVLADHDTLSISNLNRLSASVCDLNKPKVQIASEAIFEMDPYLTISIVNEGVTEKNIEYICSDNKIDLIIEECDNLETKIMVREFAQKKGIPVIMETNDRCILDIERYDIDKDYPILHGLIRGITSQDIRKLNPMEKLDLILKIFDRKDFSKGLERSWDKIGSEIIGWPQLAHEVTIGGGVVSMASIALLLNKNVKSGRYFFDPEKFLNI